MITRDEALERARTRLAALRADTSNVQLHEFEHGWVAWPGTPAAADPSRPPASTGGPQIVIDRETGAFSSWPPLPAPMVAEQYTSARSATDRFPPAVAQVLLNAGWLPGRDNSGEIDIWLSAVRGRLAPFEISSAAREFLDEFGGLVVTPPGQLPIRFAPASSGMDVGLASAFIEEWDEQVFPVGEMDDEFCLLAMNGLGELFILHPTGENYVGQGIDTALTNLISFKNWSDDIEDAEFVRRRQGDGSS